MHWRSGGGEKSSESSAGSSSGVSSSSESSVSIPGQISAERVKACSVCRASSKKLEIIVYPILYWMCKVGRMF